MLNKDAVEKALLIGIVRKKEWPLLLANSITKDYFSYANHELYDYIKEYVDKNNYPELSIIGYKFDIEDQDMREIAEIDDLQGLCDVIKTSYLSQQIRQQLGNLNEHSEDVNENPTKFVELMGQAFQSLKGIGLTNKTVGLFDNIEQAVSLDPTDVISTGFKELDEQLIGWRKGEELAVFAARTGKGKSWFALKFALAAAMQGERVGIYSGEMSLQQLQERILCCAKPSYTASKEEALKVIKAKNPVIRVLTQKELRRRANVNDIEEMIIKDKLTMIIVDQLSLMDDVTCKPGTPLRQQYGNISTDLFSLSTRYGIPCILLVQLNRQSSQDPQGPGTENLSESDMVGQNATRVITMRRDNNIAEIKVSKNRYGESDHIIKYEIDYGINKYKPIRDNIQQNQIIRKAKARQIFGGGPTF